MHAYIYGAKKGDGQEQACDAANGNAVPAQDEKP